MFTELYKFVQFVQYLESVQIYTKYGSVQICTCMHFWSVYKFVQVYTFQQVTLVTLILLPPDLHRERRAIPNSNLTYLLLKQEILLLFIENYAREPVIGGLKNSIWSWIIFFYLKTLDPKNRRKLSLGLSNLFTIWIYAIASRNFSSQMH